MAATLFYISCILRDMRNEIFMVKGTRDSIMKTIPISFLIDTIYSTKISCHQTTLMTLSSLD